MSSCYIGKKYVDDVDGNVDVNDNTFSDIVKRSELPENTRIWTQDSFGTMDYREDRFNVYLDDKGLVEETKWG